jgi:dihydroorotate dehydrogenase electron transfer subunit
MSPTAETGTQCSVDARVVRCTAVCREHVLIELEVPSFPPSDPGQFVQLRCRDVEAEPIAQTWPADGFPSVSDPDFACRRPFLRRPFSIADRWVAPDGAPHLCVISRTIGTGTLWLEQRAAGDRLNLIGPRGHGFRIPAEGEAVILVGGGVGIPPLLYLARRLRELGRNNVTAVVGATTRDLLPLCLIQPPDADGTPTTCVEWPGAADVPTVITSDDGTVGLRGFVTDGLRRWHARRSGPRAPATVCACGPEGMLRAVARLTREWGLECQLCIERNMGCGIGTCLSCIVRRRDECAPSGWRWALACSDGPVFPRDELLDYRD